MGIDLAALEKIGLEEDGDDLDSGDEEDPELLVSEPTDFVVRSSHVSSV